MPLRRNIDIDLLRAFVTIVETGSFTRTAERLLRTQSAVSLQIKRLEEALDITVFERGRKPATITPDGEQLLVHARAVLAANDAMVAHLLEPPVVGRIRIGVPEFFASLHLAMFAARFWRAYLNAEIETIVTTESEVRALFAAGELDLMFGASVAVPPGSNLHFPVQPKGQGKPIWHEPLVWIGHDTRREQPDAPLRMIAGPIGAIENEAAHAALDAVGADWRVVYRCASLAGQCAAVAAGLGVAAVPRSAAFGWNGSSNLFSGEVGLPALPVIEIRLLRAESMGSGAHRFADFVVAALMVHDHS